MNKRTIILFVLVVSLGIFLIDSLMFGLEEDSCTCIDSEALWMECEGACFAYGGCDVPWYETEGECCGIMTCEHKVINWCKQTDPEPKYVRGFHMAFNCGDCGRII